MDISTQVYNKIVELNKGTVLMHSDLMNGFSFPFRDRSHLLSQHMNKLLSICSGVDLWMPTFNYDFCKGIAYDIYKTPSAVGALTEYFRKHHAAWRTCVPVFSFAGVGLEPVFDLHSVLNPFGKGSAFDKLYKSDSLLMHYGSGIYSSTILHYAEYTSGTLVYRYDKLFSGSVICANGASLPVDVKFHVRPLNRHLEYDWDKIEKDLVSNGITTLLHYESTRIIICEIKKLIDFWKERLQADQLYFLDIKSKGWVEPLLQKLGRPFIINDFETL